MYYVPHEGAAPRRTGDGGPADPTLPPGRPWPWWVGLPPTPVLAHWPNFTADSPAIVYRPVYQGPAGVGNPNPNPVHLMALPMPPAGGAQAGWGQPAGFGSGSAVSAQPGQATGAAGAGWRGAGGDPSQNPTSATAAAEARQPPQVAQAPARAAEAGAGEVGTRASNPAGCNPNNPAPTNPDRTPSAFGRPAPEPFEASLLRGLGLADRGDSVPDERGIPTPEGGDPYAAAGSAAERPGPALRQGVRDANPNPGPAAPEVATRDLPGVIDRRWMGPGGRRAPLRPGGGLQGAQGRDSPSDPRRHGRAPAAGAAGASHGSGLYICRLA